MHCQGTARYQPWRAFHRHQNRQRTGCRLLLLLATPVLRCRLRLRVGAPLAPGSVGEVVQLTPPRRWGTSGWVESSDRAVTDGVDEEQRSTPGSTASLLARFVAMLLAGLIASTVAAAALVGSAHLASMLTGLPALHVLLGLVGALLAITMVAVAWAVSSEIRDLRQGLPTPESLLVELMRQSASVADWETEHVEARRRRAFRQPWH